MIYLNFISKRRNRGHCVSDEYISCSITFCLSLVMRHHNYLVNFPFEATFIVQSSWNLVKKCVPIIFLPSLKLSCQRSRNKSLGKIKEKVFELPSFMAKSLLNLVRILTISRSSSNLGQWVQKPVQLFKFYQNLVTTIVATFMTQSWRNIIFENT